MKRFNKHLQIVSLAKKANMSHIGHKTSVKPQVRMSFRLLVALLSPSLFAVDAMASDKLSFRDILESNLGEPGFIYKVHGCLRFDMAWAKLGRSNSNTNNKSALLNKEGERAMAQAYMKFYGASPKDYDERDSSQLTKDFSKEFFSSSGSYSLEKNVSTCMNTFSALLKGVSSLKKHSPPVAEKKSQETPNSHKACLEARDYEGCMRVNSNTKSGSSAEGDECSENLCVVKTRGTDVYGLPKPLGWRYLQADDGRLFYFSKVYRVPHKAEQSRYIGIQRITRYYQSPRAGTSGSLISGGNAYTDCVGTGASISCTTTGITPTYIPGTSSTPGGVISSAFDTVYDCRENTSASYDKGKLSVTGWRKNPGDWFGRYLRATCEEGESYRQGLDPLYIKM